MSNNIGINTTDFLLLNNDIRISSSSSYNAEYASDNIFEDLLNEDVLKQDSLEKDEKIFSNIGIPAGFFLDMSLINESEELTK